MVTSVGGNKKENGNGLRLFPSGRVGPNFFYYSFPLTSCSKLKKLFFVGLPECDVLFGHEEKIYLGAD